MWPNAQIRPCRSIAGVLLLLLLCVGSAHAQSLATYASRIAGLKGDETTIKAMKVDKEGNAYVVGDFRSASIAIDSSTLRNSGPASASLTGTTSDCFVAKFRPSGTVEWAFAFGGDKNERMVDIVLAPNGTGIFLVGNFESEVLVFSSGAGPPVENVIYGGTSQIEYYTFLIRVSPLGKIQWVSQTGNSDVASMVVDAEHDKIYLVGGYPGDPVSVEQNGEVLPNFGSKWAAGLEDDDTDDGTGSGVLVARVAGGDSADGEGKGGGGLFGRGTADIYVDHYSMRTGDFIQGIVFEGDKNDFATDMTLLPSGSALFITGYFQSTKLTLSPVLSLSSEKEASTGGLLVGGGLGGGGGGRGGEGLPAGFVVRMDSDLGTVLWGKNFGPVEASPPLQVAVDEGSKSVFVTGSFLSAGVLALSDGKTAGLLRLSQSTGGIVWARPLPRAAAVAMDLLGFVFVAGTYSSRVTWSFNVGLPVAGCSSGDVYLARVKAEDGQVVLTRNFRGERQAKYGVTAIEVDGGGNVYLGGNYTQGSLGVGGQVLVSPGTSVDGFVGRVLLPSEMSVTMTPGSELAPLSLPSFSSSTTTSSSSSSSSSSTSSSSSSGGIFGDRKHDKAAAAAAAADGDEAEEIKITSLIAGGATPPAPTTTSSSSSSSSSSSASSSSTTTTKRAPTRAPTVSPPPASASSESSSSPPPPKAVSTPRPSTAPDNRPTKAPTMRPTALPCFRLTWAPTADLPAKATVTTAGAATPPETAKAAAAPAATVTAIEQSATTSIAATTPTAPRAPFIPTKNMDISLVYAGPASDITSLQVGLYQVLKPHISSYLSLPAVKLGTGRRRRILHGRQRASGEECSDPSSPKILQRFGIECDTEAAAVTVVRLLEDILSGKIVLRTGVRTIATSLVCSLTATETVIVKSVKEADAPLPPSPVSITSDSSSASLSALAEEEAKGGKKKVTVGVGFAIAFSVLAALALLAGFGYRKAKKERAIREAEEMRDAEWQRRRVVDRRGEEEAKFVPEPNGSGGETQVSPELVSTAAASASSASHTAVSMEQQEEGRH